MKQLLTKTIIKLFLIFSTSYAYGSYKIEVRVNLSNSDPAPEAAIDTIKCWDLNTEPLPPYSISTTTGVATITITTTTPVQFSVFLPVPGFGTVYVYADNDGKGYTSSDTGVLFFATAAKKTRFNRVKTAAETVIANGIPLRSDFMTELLASENLGVYDSLAKTMKLGEELVLAKARYEIKKLGTPRKSFLFGANTFMHYWAPAQHDPLYKAVFNFGTGWLYWAGVEPSSMTPRDFSRADAEMNWIPTFGTTKVCAIVYYYPEFLRTLSFADFKPKALNWVTEVVTRYKNVAQYYEVINEHHDAWNPNRFDADELNILTKEALETAKQSDPKGLRIVNHTQIFADYANKVKSTKRSPLKYLKDIISVGAEFEVIGLQFYYPKQDLFEIDRKIDQFMVFNKPIHITEQGCSSQPFDDPQATRDTPPGPGWHGDWTENMQADWIEQLYSIFYSKQLIKAIQWWDLIDNWWAWGGLVRRDFTPKPSYTRLLALRNGYWCDYEKSPKIIEPELILKTARTPRGIKLGFVSNDKINLTKSFLRYRSKDNNGWSNVWETVNLSTSIANSYYTIIPSTVSKPVTNLIEYQFEVANTTGYYTVTPLKTIELISLDPPTNLKVSDANEGCKLKLEWDITVSTNAKSYLIYKSEKSGTGYNVIVDSSLIVSTSCYLDTNIETNKYYYYRITAQDYFNNESSCSNETAGIVVVFNDLPPATPNGLTISDPLTGGQLNLTWTLNTEPDFKYYKIYRSNDDNLQKAVIISTATTNQYNDTSLINNTTYYYWLRAFDKNNNGSGFSYFVFGYSTYITTSAVSIYTPVWVGITDNKIGGSLTLKWNTTTEPEYMSRYNVYRSNSNSGQYSLVNTVVKISTAVERSYNDVNLINNLSYYYVLTSVDMFGNESVKSLPMVGVPTGVMSVLTSLTPQGLQATSLAEGKSLLLQWTEVNNDSLKNYIIYRLETEDGQYTPVAFPPKGVSLCTDTSLTDNTTYFYKITTVDIYNNQTAFSTAIASGTPVDRKPPQIGVIQVTPEKIVGFGEIKISFSINEKLKPDTVPVVKVNNRTASYVTNYPTGNNLVFYLYTYNLGEKDFVNGQRVDINVEVQDTVELVGTSVKSIVAEVLFNTNKVTIMPNVINFKKSVNKVMIQYWLNSDAKSGDIKIYNIAGEIVRTLPINSLSRGVYSVE